MIAELSSGIPRVINVLADRAMMAAFTQSTMEVGLPMVECAQADLEGVHA